MFNMKIVAMDNSIKKNEHNVDSKLSVFVLCINH